MDSNKNENVDNTEKKKKQISKYDMVKVKIRLEGHFFVFSRYLLANLLRVIQVINLCHTNTNSNSINITILILLLLLTQKYNIYLILK